MSLVALRLLSVDRLLLHGGRGPHTRCTGADAAKQRTVAYLSGRGRGNRCFCRRELITIVTPLSRPGSAKTAASLCLYSVYRKQERSLFTAALEQTSNVKTAIIRPRPTAGLWSPILSIRLAIASLCHAARLRFDRCATAAETWPLPAVSPPIFTRPSPPPCDVDRLSSPAVSDEGGGGDSPARRPGADGRCTSPVALPGRFGRTTMLIVRRRRLSSVIGRERRRVRPVTPPSRPRRRSNSDHAAVLGRNRLPVSHFPNRFPVLKPVTGFPVPV